MKVNESKYISKYSDDSFWRKVTKFAMKAGRKLILIAITLWETMQDKNTPLWARTKIIAALGYFIWPFDFVPDFLPGGGYLDDFAVLTAAMACVIFYVKDVHRQRASEKCNNWFGEDEGPSGALVSN
jgi:uncharacterized membrane protein YkvA (DUF1232 family)